MRAPTTHEIHDTVGHSHLDAITHEGGGLLIVECRDGRFYLEVDHGDFPNSPGLVQKSIDSKTEPTFYEDENTAGAAALEIMRRAYPNIPEKWFIEKSVFHGIPYCTKS